MKQSIQLSGSAPVLTGGSLAKTSLNRVAMDLDSTSGGGGGGRQNNLHRFCPLKNINFEMILPKVHPGRPSEAHGCSHFARLA